MAYSVDTWEWVADMSHTVGHRRTKSLWLWTCLIGLGVLTCLLLSHPDVALGSDAALPGFILLMVSGIYHKQHRSTT